MRHLPTLLFTLLTLSSPLSAQPEPPADTTDIFDASEVVISASRWDEKARTVSREITKVTPLQIQQRNPATTADALAQTGVVHVQKSQLGGGSPMLRGYAANAVLMVVDGVRINNAIYRGGNLQNVISVDAASLDGLEVLFGPGSVQYGSDALGGVMNFRTRQPFFADNDKHTLFGGTAMVRYGSAMNEVTASAAIDLGTQYLASSTVFTYSTFSDLRGGGQFMSAYPNFGARPWYVEQRRGLDTVVANPDPSVQVPTGYEQVNILQNLSFKVTGSSTLKYTGIFTTSTNIPRYDRLLQERNDLPRFAQWEYGPQIWTLQALTFTANDLGSIADRMVATGSYQYYEESRISRQFQNPDRRTQTENVKIGAVNLDLQKELADDGLESDLYYGLEAYINDVGSSAEETEILTGITQPATSRYPDGGSMVTSAAAYAQIRLGLTEDLTLAGGLRYTWYDLRSTVNNTTLYPFSDLSLTTGALTGSVGVTWAAAPSLIVHSNASNGFRAPNVDDIAKVFDSAPGVLIVPNANLGPEYATTIETGIEVLPWQGASARVNAYRTWSTDAIERRPTTLNGKDSVFFDGVQSAVFTNVNVGSADIVGVNVEVATPLATHLHLRATASWNDGEDVNGVGLRHIPPAFGSAALSWRADQWSLAASFWWAAAKPFDELPPEEQAKVGINYTEDGTPAWQRVDLQAMVTALQNVDVILQVENLFDLNYKTFASAISAPGRNMVVSARYRW